MKISSHYKGKEQSFIKHRLLETYLERLFMIIGQHENRIRYVDCFAGPWKAETDDLKDTSIAISLSIMKSCHESLRKQGKNIRFKALFIEKNIESYKRLDSFLKKESTEEVSAESLHGDFYSLRSDILRWCGNDDFTFFFIDPTGWKDVVEIDTLRPLLQRRRSEYLINFMFYSILRVHNQTIFEEHIIRIFGEIPDTNGMTPLEREEYLLCLYRAHLKKAQPDIENKKSRSAYVKILDPYKDRTKYNLVYLTRHPLGIKVFMEASEKLDLVQKFVRAKVKQERRIDKSGQKELFPAEINIANEDKVDLSDVKDYWLSKLSFKPKRFGIEELADMLEETDWFISDFQKAFNELISEGQVKNLDASRKRPVHAVHFDKGELLKRLNS
ncbi:MAG: three-Cys-motif partner protein TcmP [Deltaproteobacteria bacterium]|jgi:three-Cys-motif partner protein|nr:three-Cys-motif partner protein TcmP [Deltaproteobacteria bacterium]